VEIFYCVLVEGARSKTGVAAALAHLLRDPRARCRTEKSQFASDSMKTLGTHASRARCSTASTTGAGIRSAACGLHCRSRSESAGTVHLFRRRLLNYDDWRIAEGRSPRSFSTIKSSTPTLKPNAIISA